MQSSQRAINAINQAIEKKTKEQVEFSPGRIHEIYKEPAYTYSGVSMLLAIATPTEGDGYLASAYLGVDDLVEEIIIPAGAYVSSGDYVVVATNAEGKSWIDRMIPNSLYSKIVNDVHRGRFGIGNGDTGDFDFGAAGQAIVSSGPDGSVAWGIPTIAHADLTNTGPDDHHDRLHDHSDALDGIITRPIVKRFFTTGTWVKPSKLAYIIVEVQGAGGGGGGSQSTSANEASAGSGGGGGGYTRKLLTAENLTNTTNATVTVGTGGAGGTAGNDGAKGGDSAFTGTGFTSVQGIGGDKGLGGAAGSVIGIIEGGAGGTGSGGDITVPGDDGGNGVRLSLPGVSAASPIQTMYGGGSFLAGTQTAPNQNVAGNDGNTFGGGGSGSGHSQSQTGHGGGSGANGVVIVTEYYL